ncbi:ABC transporter substrate-binding protein [Deinococcus misasensis]|uniref:ABC transporter substrate-binding protein n=1 Tax=Deinococcus misasensis TaxID=392413 RepID=UPI00054EA808|nr:ABC transporter substrate-binding protein [Deinococcus misasensis]
MKKTALLLGAILLTATAGARTFDEIKASGTIKIATEGAFKPFNYFEGKKLTGFEVEVGDAIAKKLGLKVQWITQPFDSLIIGVTQNRYDFAIASHGINEERAKVVDFTDPHYCTGGQIVSKSPNIKTAAQLNGKRVAVQVGTSYLSNVQKVKGVKVKTFPKDTDAVAALVAGTVDAWVSDKFVVLDAQKANPKVKWQLGDLLFQEKIAMVVNKGNDSVTEALNGALADIIKDGTYAKISKKYFNADVRCK